MAAAEYRANFRLNVGDSSGTVFTDEEIDALRAAALAVYPTGDADLLMAHMVVSGLRQLMVNAAKRTSYTQANSSESASDVFRALREMHEIWRDVLRELAGSATPAVRWGGMTPHPPRDKEWPDA